MKKEYMIVKENGKYNLYFLDKEFMIYEFIKSYNKDVKIIEIYNELKNKFKNKYTIKLELNI